MITRFEILGGPNNNCGQRWIQRVDNFNLSPNSSSGIIVSSFHRHRGRGIVTQRRVIVQVGIIFGIIEQRLKGTMTVVAKIETYRVIEIGVSDELVNGMFRGRQFAIWGTNLFGNIIRIDGVGCDGRGGKERIGITSVTVIQGPEGDEVGKIVKSMTGEEITKVMEVRNVLISSMAVDHIVMVNTLCNGGVVSRTVAELVFKEEDFATCATRQNLSIKGFARSCKGGESIVVGVFSVNCCK